MTPQKCIERKCPRHGLHQGTDVCILYQVSQTKKDLAVLDVFNVTEKQCKRLREDVKEWMKSEEGRRFAQPTEVVVAPVEDPPKPDIQQESPRD